MKTKIILSVIFGLLSTFGLTAQTYYYNATKIFNENGYTYQCDVPEWNLVTLYNKTNVYTYEDMYYKNGGGVYRYNGKNNTVQDDSWTKPKCFAIVNGAFSNTEKQRIKNRELSITLIISPTTGKIVEVNFRFHNKSGFATIPISVYRQIELKLKNEIWFTPTTEGKKLNYIMHFWRHEVR